MHMRIGLILILLSGVFLTLSCQRERSNIFDPKSALHETQDVITVDQDGTEYTFPDGSKMVIPSSVISAGTRIEIGEKGFPISEPPKNTSLISPVFTIEFPVDSIVKDSFVDFTDTIGIKTSINTGEVPISRVVVTTPSGIVFPFYKPVLDVSKERIPGVPMSYFKNVVCSGQEGNITFELSVFDFPQDKGGEQKKGLWGTMYEIEGVDSSNYILVTSQVDLEGKMPLILVHGWTFFPDGSYIWQRKKCIYENWHNLIDYYYDHSVLENNYKLFAFRYVRNVHITTAAEALDDLIADYFNINNDSIVFVAHSMGGLVCREYIVDCGGHTKTKRLVTLATPHHGSIAADMAVHIVGYFPFAIPAWLSTYDLCWDDMVYDVQGGTNNFLENLNTSDPYTEKYKLFRGYIASDNHGDKYLFADSILTQFATEPSSDGIVPTTSSMWEDHPGPFDGDIVHFPDYNHSQMHTENNVFESLYNYLVGLITEDNFQPNTPSTPSGPPNGYVDSTYSFSTSTTDPEGDNIAYQFDWGDGNTSGWGSYVSSGQSVSMNHIYSSEGTYYVKAKAKDENGAESGWSSGHSISISSLTNSPPNTPNAPSGPDSGYVDSTYSFSASTTDPEGDNISYQFDWGDGNTSGWGSYVSSGQSVSMNHIYSSEGTYYVKAKAKDENGAESGWSSGHSIVVSSITNSPPNTPGTPSGPGNGYVDSTYTFTASTTDPDGDNVAYQFDWGDGNTSGWSSHVSSGQSVSMNHIYSSEGIYYVKAKAKDENGAESGWSNSHEIVISSIGHGHGTLKWSFMTGGRVLYSSPAIGSDGTIYVGSWDDNKLYAINPDGTEKWEFTTGSEVESSPAIGSDGTIYVGSRDNKLYAINPDGTEKWEFTTGSEVESSPAIGSDGTVYVGSDDHKLYAINPDGTEKWSFTTGDRVYSSPAIGSDGAIYVGSHDDKLYAINPDGTEKWSFTTGAWVESSPAIGSDGTIYVGSHYELYAIYGSSGGLANTPWPMFHHDLKHTGRVGGGKFGW